MEDQAIQVFQTEERPLSVVDIKNQVHLIQEIMQGVMRDGEHYGKIPGCGDKPALLKAGAEKLNLTFRMNPDPIVEVTDLGNGHREYRVKLIMYSITTGKRLGAGVGSANTMETKWRYRTGPVEFTEKQVPKEYWDVRKSDPEKALSLIGGKGFITAKSDAGAWMIARRGERVEHDNPADYYNTCEKMAKKRALVDAVLTVTGASDIFTQDIEEMEVHSPTTQKQSIPAVHPAATEAEEDKEFNRAADAALSEADDPTQCPCGAKLSEKALDYYDKNPNKERICYTCNQSKKASLPYGKNRKTEREPGSDG